MATKKTFVVEAETRESVGQGASRRLRREEKVPGIVYGAGQKAAPLVLEQKKLSKALENEAFYSHILTLNIDSKPEKVILKDLQRHPFKASILHVDFQRVRADEKLEMHVPLHFIGSEETPGVKEGGIISHIESDVLVSCLPDDLPEYIEVDISTMQLNDILHLSDLTPPKNVEFAALKSNDDKSLVSVHMPRIEEEPEPAPEEEIAPSEVPASAQKAEEEPPKDEGKK